MNIHAIASEIASRIPEMTRGNVINNTHLIETLLLEELGKHDQLLLLQWKHRDYLLQAKCAEMRSVLERSKTENLGHRCADSWFIARDRALSGRIGLGWTSPEKTGKLREYVAFLASCVRCGESLSKTDEAQIKQVLEETK